MDTEKFEIGSFEAKTRLSELLRETEGGRSFLILRRGKPVARLVPVDSDNETGELNEIIEGLSNVRKKISGQVSVEELVEEGRRW